MVDEKLVHKVIVCLLFVFLPLTMYSMFLKVTYVEPNLNPDMNTYYNGSLYLFDGDVLLGTYECVDCEFTSINGVELPLLKDSFKFVSEADSYTYVNITNGISILSLDSVIYDENTINNEFIVISSGGKYGTFSLDTASVRIHMKYDLIDYSNPYSTLKLLVNESGKNYIVSYDDAVLSDKYSSNVDLYTDKYIFSDNSIFTYEGDVLFERVSYMFVDGAFYAIVFNDILYIYNNLESNILDFYKLESYENIHIIDNNGTLEVYDNGKLIVK